MIIHDYTVPQNHAVTVRMERSAQLIFDHILLQDEIPLKPVKHVVTASRRWLVSRKVLEYFCKGVGLLCIGTIIRDLDRCFLFQICLVRRGFIITDENS
jgi:hypothetical protein